jgi:hypothetical protein
VIIRLAPNDPAFANTGLSPESIQSTLSSQWINGAAMADQVNIAKSLIKLRLTPATSAALASATAVDATVLQQVAQKISAGTSLSTGETSLSTGESNVYGRFDLMLTTLLHQAYQRADQRYRNWAKGLAVVVSVILAVAANCSLGKPLGPWEAVIIGLIATPLAPIAKDVASAIQTASQAVQAVKKV